MVYHNDIKYALEVHRCTIPSAHGAVVGGVKWSRKHVPGFSGFSDFIFIGRPCKTLNDGMPQDQKQQAIMKSRCS